MGIVSTKELLNAYYNSVKGTKAEKTRHLIDKPELYEYEKKIGKELIDMNVDDLFGLVFELENKRKGKEIEYMISHSNYDQLSCLLRTIWNFYIDEYTPIKNPWYDKRMKGREATKRLAQGRKRFSWEMIEDVITKLHKDYDEDNADYVELILLLFYNGFSKADEIVTLKADMINHYYKEVKFESGRIIHLQPRTYELLMKFNKMEKMPGWRGDYLLLSWRGSFFKFIVRPSQEYKLNDRPQSAMRDNINRMITNKVNDNYGVRFNYHMLYMLGFYEYIVAKHGEEKTNKMITSFRNSDDVAELMNLSKEYGVAVDNISHLKRYLRPFVTAEANEQAE